MSRQSELSLENELIEQLEGLGYERVKIANEKELVENLKNQIEKHNKITLNDSEFNKILSHLKTGTIFERAHKLRDKFHLAREDGTEKYIEFLDVDRWCQNQFQVANQISMQGAYKNRYDVTLLINGLPLVQIELKRRGLEMQEAFRQIKRYHKHSYSSGHGLFGYVQMFVISNGVNTRYFANNRVNDYQAFNFKQVFHWTDINNHPMNKLSDFTSIFLEPCHISKMICKYMVMSEVGKSLMVLRPYQYYAVEKMYNQVENTNKNGYIWHATGSGKTLTSFKASQVIMQMQDISKVVFVVDRKDLDYQTAKEFNSFQKGSVDGTDNTHELIEHFNGDNKLIITTIQKLNNAVKNPHYSDKINSFTDKRIVFIFDECHRSQFGESHANIKGFFKKSQMFGFTGTPIFAENAIATKDGKRTTKMLFDECLHQYLTYHAIKDQNVLRFSIEYFGRYKEKDHYTHDMDIEADNMDKKEILESEERIEKIVNHVISTYDKKTHNRTFNAILAVSSINALFKYYDLLKKKKENGEHSLKVATIFSFAANEEKEFTGDENDDIKAPTDKYSRDKLEEYISDYNGMFESSYSTESQEFQNYYQDISKKVKDKNIDILLVVNMFLTGFDSKFLNTIYVDKNLRYHGLIQAFSRTNRTLDSKKSQGNIVCYRNLKDKTDEAFRLFSDKDSREEVFIRPYKEYVENCNKAIEEVRKIAPTCYDVDTLETEDDDLKFVKSFREVIRTINVLKTFVEFKYDDLDMDEQEIEDYQSKYLDIYESTKGGTGGGGGETPTVNDVNFEIDLIHSDIVNTSYILKLLKKVTKGSTSSERKKQIDKIKSMVESEISLRSKRDLILKFIDENNYSLSDMDDIEDSFDVFMKEKENEEFEQLCISYKLQHEPLKDLINKILFRNDEPLCRDIVNIMEHKPKMLEREAICNSAKNAIMNFIERFCE